jgi:predicted transcriptional regulator
MRDFHSRSRADLRESVVFSFEDRWKTPILKNQIAVFFRKRAPTSVVPRQVFFYVSAPTSSVVGFARIVSQAKVTKPEAIEHRLAGKISELELNRYISERDTVYMIRIADQQNFKRQVHFTELLRLGVFHPPETFFFLSQWGVSTLKELGGISVPAT